MISFIIFILANNYKNILKYINERVVMLVISSSIIVIIIIVFKRLFVRGNNLCISLFTAKYAPRLRVVEEATRLANMLKVLSKYGIIIYSLDEGRLELRIERSATKLSDLFKLYGRGLVLQYVGTCNSQEICKIIYFNDINSINIKCRNSVVILFKYYKISRDKYDYVIDLSNIIGIDTKIRFLLRRLSDVLQSRYTSGGTELCIVLIDPVEYNISDINKIIRYIKKYIGNINIKIKCIIAINAIEKHIYPRL